MYTIYYNGTIVTMCSSAMYAEAVVTRKKQIVFVGSYAQACQLYKTTRTRMVNLNGNTMLPGFIDGHSHFSMVFQQSAIADISSCNSYNAIAETLKKYMAEQKINKKGLVLGFGYDNNQLPDCKHPDKTLLDSISVDIPIIIMHVSGHMCVANSKALELAEITADTPQPEGGVIGHFPDSNTLNGYLEENASFLVLKLLKGRMKFSPFKMLKDSQLEYLRHGITTVQDGATNSKTFTLLKFLSFCGLLKFDLVSYLLMDKDGIVAMHKNRKYHNVYHRNLKIGGYKLILDGSPQAKSAWLTEPYEGEQHYCGYPRLKDDIVTDYCQKAIDENVQLLAHCNGDAASDQYINCYTSAYNQSRNPNKSLLRPVMVHCQTVRTDQLEKMKSLHMIASIFVGHVYYWGDTHLKNLGQRRGNYISPARTAINCGLSVNFHQDTPVTKPDMLHSIWCAVNRTTKNNVPLASTEKISVLEALQAVTINSAYAYHEEDCKGSIESEKKADFVILSQNPLTIESSAIKDISVLETIKEGKCVFHAPTQN